MDDASREVEEVLVDNKKKYNIRNKLKKYIRVVCRRRS